MNRPSAAVAFRTTAILGFVAVASGAFGAHALKPVLVERGGTEFWEKAVFYHFVHAGVMLLASTLRPFPRWAWIALGAGVLGFSGSLYLYALTHVKWLVFITPLGGLALLTGWLLLAFRKIGHDDGFTS